MALGCKSAHHNKPNCDQSVGNITAGLVLVMLVLHVPVVLSVNLLARASSDNIRAFIYLDERLRARTK